MALYMHRTDRGPGPHHRPRKRAGTAAVRQTVLNSRFGHPPPRPTTTLTTRPLAYHRAMEPFTSTAILTAVLSQVDWKHLLQSLADEAAIGGAKGILRWLKPDAREKAARAAIQSFATEFAKEIEAATPLTAAIPGYSDQLSRLIEHAGPDIAAWMSPETKSVDLGPIERIWNSIGSDPLPEDFDWDHVAKSFARSIARYAKSDPDLRAALQVSLSEQQAELLGEIAKNTALAAPLDPGFDLTGYRTFIQGKCAVLQLSAMHTSTYDRRIHLWSVFVPQSARESVPVREIPREIKRHLREEGHIMAELDLEEAEQQAEAWQNSAANPILDILQRNRLVVILGDPGSGKTSLLKFLLLQWLNAESQGRPQQPLPLWIDLKDYAQSRPGFLEYLESGAACFCLNSTELDRRLTAGTAQLYVDGLDEVFDGPTRGAVVQEIIAFSARYPQASLVVTSRIIGYEPDPLRNAGFIHATLDDFDDSQIRAFLTRWHVAAEDDPKEHTRLTAQLQRALSESRAIRELAGNPLLLTMMVILNRTQDLPRDRVELYAQASRVLLHEWDASRFLPTDTFGRPEKEDLLRELAGIMQQAEGGLAGNLIDRPGLVSLFRDFLDSLGVSSPYGTAMELVKKLTERNFILCFAGANRFSFVHRTFLEFFCASWFVDQFHKRQCLTLDQLKSEVFGRHWRDESWHEVLRLIAGMVSESQAAELIRFLMQQDGRSHKMANLILAAGCLSEVRKRHAIRELDEELRVKFLASAVRYEPPHYCEDRELSSLAAPTRVKAVHLLAFVWHSEQTRSWLMAAATDDPDRVVRAAAIQELARGWKDHPETLPLLNRLIDSPDAWPVRDVAMQEFATGWRDEQETFPWLMRLAGSGGDTQALTAALHILARGWKDHPDTLPLVKAIACSSDDQSGQFAAMQVLARTWPEHPESRLIVAQLATTCQDVYLRSRSTLELGRNWPDHPETLNTLLRIARWDPRPTVRASAVQAFKSSWIRDPRLAAWLKGMLSTEAEEVQISAIRAVVRGCRSAPDTLPWLRECAATASASAVREAAYREIAWGWREDLETLSWFQQRAHADSESQVRSAAVQEIARARNGDDRVLPWLKSLAISSGDQDVQCQAVHELSRGWREDPGTLPLLKELTSSSDAAETVRRSALLEVARGWVEDSQTLSWLQSMARSDFDWQVRRAAIKELARNWLADQQILLLIIDVARTDENGFVRISAIQALDSGRNAHPEALPILNDLARNSTDPAVRREAVYVLGEICRGAPGVVSIITEIVRSDEDPNVRLSALYRAVRGKELAPDALSLLKERAELDPDGLVRVTALEIAGWFTPPSSDVKICRELIQENASLDVRISAIHVLSNAEEVDPETAVLLRQCARSDEDEGVRRAALNALANIRIDDPETPSLLKERALSDPADSVRGDAIEALATGWKTDPETLLILKQLASSDEGTYISMAARRQLVLNFKDDPDSINLLSSAL